MSDLVPVRGPLRMGDYVELGGGRIAVWSRGHIERITSDGYLVIGYGPQDWPEYFRSHNEPVEPREVVRAWRRVFTSDSHPAAIPLPDEATLHYRTERRWAWAQITLDAPNRQKEVT